VSGGYNLGVAKSSDTSTDWIWDSTFVTNNQTIFVVGSYTFTTTGNNTDDIAKLWVNPDPATFGSVNAPTPSATATTGNDITANSIASFVFFQRSSTLEPAAIVADELRISTNWAGVTPPTVAPLITAQPTNQTVSVGSAATFSVTAMGMAPLNYQWQFNGGNIPGATNSVYTRTNAQRYDAGNYSVLVTNVAGSLQSSNAVLTVTSVTPVHFSGITDLHNGLFSLQGSGDPGSFAIDTSTNLVNWIQITNVFGTNGTFQFTDAVTNAPQRYFRARLLP
jgi:hypothetical protein